MIHYLNRYQNMNDISEIARIYNKIERIDSDTLSYTLNCGRYSCTECSRQRGLLRECPICGVAATYRGKICGHSYVCNDFAGTRFPSGCYYISGVLVNQKELIELASRAWCPEDDII